VHELVVLLGVVVAMLVATTFISNPLGRVLRRVEVVFATLSVIVIIFVMFFVGAEVLMRYVFNSPIPGHLEGSELLFPIIVFLAISYTQATHGHVGMDLVRDALPPAGKRVAAIIALGVSIVLCSVLAYFTAKNALQLYEYDDVTMTPPYIRTWPAAAAIPIGYAMVGLRMWLQLLHQINPQRFEANEPDATELQSPE
jgi:TRAP-type C4-dicarboxylate transport system permease small subunit